jgi:hypothetical protein
MEKTGGRPKAQYDAGNAYGCWHRGCGEVSLPCVSQNNCTKKERDRVYERR